VTGPTPRKNPAVRLGLLPLALLGVFLVVTCGSREQSTPTPLWPPSGRIQPTASPDVPSVQVSLTPKDVSIRPLPVQAGYPFTVTLVIHNDGGAPTPDLPVMVYIAPELETIGYSPFMEVLTVTLPSTRPVSLEVPVRWNLAGGENRLWVQVNRLPKGWLSDTPTWPEEVTSDNSALVELTVQPFDAYRSDLCSGRVDLEIDTGVVAQPGSERVRVPIYNAGNQAAYNLPVVVSGQDLSGIAYAPAIPPCGGTAEVWVPVDRPLIVGESIAVSVNPEGWEGGLAEDDFTNNGASAQVARPAPESILPEPVDYDFALTPQDVESPAQWLLLVTVHNLGTRYAAKVPIRIENQAGRKVNDVIPLVQGNGTGVAAIRVGTLWTRGGTLTLTVNPTGARGGLPESDRSNNVTTFTLP